jgi:hypothetical protein
MQRVALFGHCERQGCDMLMVSRTPDAESSPVGTVKGRVVTC